MVSMVERVARVVAENQRGARNWEGLSSSRQREFLDLAQVVIDSMRDPTKEMCDAGSAALPEFDDDFGGTVKPDAEDASTAWQAMISAALNR